MSKEQPIEGGVVLDPGSGHGLPLSRTLLEDGFVIHAIDASPGMVAAFQRYLPQARVTCEPAENSGFFGRQFDGILAWGLVFLLDEAAQRRLIRRAARAWNPGGRFLFTAPAQPCTWPDAMTGQAGVFQRPTAGGGGEDARPR